ncbi:39S mitochondrial ribosomal protein L46-domain-containing protein [Dichotomopilus funicola]|uniref:Large ribosomal subunit protein mL46 n=1 Tax=Dichotomopilus funicola TaxID=1934379 RepID=A0AAN6ZQG8_9PEZI|nr:39S mitochondrial ribosomal protein L46-domain-containing protein [Dichotomopilus funicola]
MMSAPGRGSALLRGSQRVCTQCARPAPRPRITTTTTFPAATTLTSRAATLPLASRRYYAVEAATSTASTPHSAPQPPSATQPPAASTSSTTTTTSSNPSTSNAAASTSTAPTPQPNPPLYRIKSALILSRPPLLTRDQHPFESAFYLYQKRLNDRLTAPFRRPFYFRQNTATDIDFRMKLRERHGVPAKDIGRYNSRGRMAWNDEVLVGSTTSDPQVVVEKLLADAEMRISEDGEPITAEERVPVERPMPRRSEADEKGDVKRLDRAMDRTLYLVVRKGEGEEGVWGFPAGMVMTEETLDETAARVLAESAGINMNTWLVGRVPVAHHVTPPQPELDIRGEKTFFIKGRIMAGQADLTGNTHGLTDFRWLTREELEELLPEKYFKSVRGMMDLR